MTNLNNYNPQRLKKQMQELKDSQKPKKGRGLNSKEIAKLLRSKLKNEGSK
jgi:hypothetical protein